MTLFYRTSCIFLLIVSFFLLPLLPYAHSATDSFTVKQLIGDDSTPPSTPTSLVASPVAQTQIDLSWGASTDDYILNGYQVFRDAIQIATTTLTTYSDTGLTASTTYTYFVRAFDSFYNISSSSNSVATTTLPIVATTTPTTTPTTSGGGSNLRVELVSFSITPALYSAEIDWETSRYAQFDLRWGRTGSYELGFVTTNVFRKENQTLISDLQPGTVYEYQLVSHDRDGRSKILKEGQFTTLDAPDTQAPANVSNLQAYVEGEDIRLTWDNPEDNDFSHVRVVRNYLFYPTGIHNGYVVYQDSGDTFFDKNAFSQHEIQYYTVFSYDTSGNISSGAIIAVYKNTPPQTTTESPEVWNFNFDDIELLQNNLQVQPTNINGDIPLVFRVAYDLVPEHLKAITVTLTHPEDVSRSFSFLLKINKDKTFYEATVAPFVTGGRYPLRLVVFDYQTKELFTAVGALEVHKKIKKPDFFGIPLTTETESTLPKLILWLLLFMIVLYFLYRASKMDILMQNNYEVLTKVRVGVLIFGAVILGAVFWHLVQAIMYLETGKYSNQSIVLIGSDFSSWVVLVSAGVFLLLTLLFVKRKN